MAGAGRAPAQRVWGERTAVKALGVNRSSIRYQPKAHQGCAGQTPDQEIAKVRIRLRLPAHPHAVAAKLAREPQAGVPPVGPRGAESEIAATQTVKDGGAQQK